MPREDDSLSVIDLFLCHASPDKEWVRNLAEQIESETFDGRADGRRLRVFFDEWDVDGEDFLTRMDEGLDRARYVAVVISPALLQAKFATLEWHHILAEDPQNRKRRLIPILHQDYDDQVQRRIDLPAGLRVLNYIDFRRAREFKHSFAKLVRRVRDLPPARGRRRRPLAGTTPVAASLVEYETSADPDTVDEVILGNLLPVEDFPTTVWSAEARSRSALDVRRLSNEPRSFVLRSKRLYTFFDLNHAAPALSEVVDRSTIEGEAVSQLRSDPNRWGIVTELLNRCVREFLAFGKFPIRFDRSHNKYFFLPEPDGSSRQWRNGRDPIRKVAARMDRADGQMPFWVHHCADIRIRTLGTSFYLLVEPGYAFSRDGKWPTSAPWIAGLHQAWTARERNAAILRSIVFWARTLGNGRERIAIPTGGAALVVRSTPALARTQVGIETDVVNVGTLLERGADDLDHAAALVRGAE